MAGSLPQLSFHLRAIYLLGTFALLIGCSTVKDQTTKSLSDNLSSDDTFCTISAGVWNCDSVTPKTPIQKALKKTTSSKKQNASEAQGVSRSKKITHMNSEKVKKDPISIPLIIVSFDDDSVAVTKQHEEKLREIINDLNGYALEVHSYIYPESSKQEEWLAFDRAQRVKAFLESFSSLTVSIKRADHPYTEDSSIGKSQVAVYLANTH